MPHSSKDFELAVVIPVWNDSEGLVRLLPQFLALPEVKEIIVVDDASDRPFAPENYGMGDLRQDCRFKFISSRKRRGAGHARNIGLGHVSAPFVLFFDSDDIILQDFQELLTNLASNHVSEFDFCMFRHVDSRLRAKGKLQPLESDQFHWEMIGAKRHVSAITREQASRLCRVSAYPWNKIYRTDFLRTEGIKCTEIILHNDIELHWTSFFRARNILVSTRICCEHFVQADGGRLTNRSGHERLQVFSALNAMHNDLSSKSEFTALFADAVLEFYINLFEWIQKNIEEDVKEIFQDKIQDFITTQISFPLVTLAALNDPFQAQRLNKILERSY